MDLSSVNLALWLFFWAYWMLGTGSTKKIAQKAQSVRVSFLASAALLLGFFLLFSNQASIGILGQRFIPLDSSSGIPGLAIFLLGIGFAIWARFHLGKNWSSIAAIKEGHKLIASGPYQVVRHPIYTGIFVGMLGSAIVVGEWKGLLAVALNGAVFWIRIKAEEKILNQQFPEAYSAYVKKVKAFIPFVL